MKIRDILSEISDLTRSRPNTPPPGTKIATPKVAAGTGADGPAGKYARPKVAAGTGADGPAGKYATPKVAVGTGADGPAGRYATPKVKPGTGADGPAGKYAKAKTRPSTSTVSGSAINQQAQAKFNQRQPSSVAKTTKKPSGTIGNNLSNKTLDDRK